MNIKGFKSKEGKIHKYDYDALENVPENSGYVKSVNGNTPDENGNVEIAVSGGSGGISNTAVNLLVAILGECATYTDQSANIAALKVALMESASDDSGGGNTGGGDDSGGGEDETPTVTVTSISAVFNGETAHAGTYASDLDITVTAEYSDGTSAVVTDYTISGQVAEGENTFTIIYGGKSCTVTVVGVLAPDWSVYDYTLKEAALSTGLTPFATDQSFTMLLDFTNIHTDGDSNGAFFATTNFSIQKRKGYDIQIMLNGSRVLGTMRTTAMATGDRLFATFTHTAGNDDFTVNARIVNASGAADFTYNNVFTVDGWISGDDVMTAMSEYYGNRLVCNGAEVYMNYVADADMIAAWLARGDS